LFIQICDAAADEKARVTSTVGFYPAGSMQGRLRGYRNKVNDLQWPWVPISRQNPFSNCTAVARLP